MATETQPTKQEVRQRLSFIAGELHDLSRDANEVYGVWSSEALEISFLWERAISTCAEIKPKRRK